MNERIKELRKVLKLTQQEFAESIKVKRNAKRIEMPLMKWDVAFQVIPQ